MEATARATAGTRPRQGQGLRSGLEARLQLGVEVDKGAGLGLGLGRGPGSIEPGYPVLGGWGQGQACP